MKKTVFFSGTFDILTAGHVRSFKFAKSQGDVLVVALNTDEIIAADKGREHIFPYRERKEILEALGCIDLVIPQTDIMAMPLLKTINPDVFVLNKEWEDRHREAIAWMEANGGKVVWCERYADVMCGTDARNRTVEVVRNATR